MKQLNITALVIVFAALIASSASAVVIYNNFGSGDTFDTAYGWTISDGPPINQDTDQGDSFTVGGSTNITVTDIYVALGYVTGKNEAYIWLMDDAGGLPGSVIKQYTITNMGSFGSAYTPSHIVDGAGPTLVAGQSYWLVASGTNSSQGTWLAWNWNNTGAVGPHAYRVNMGSWTPSQDVAGAFRIEGNPIPEPVTLSLMGLAAVPFLRRRK